MSRLRFFAMLTAALGAAVLLFILWSLPPRQIRLAAPPAGDPARPVVPGAFHVHTVASDGTGTIAQVADAAARAGLRFVIFADHGDGTSPPVRPAYHAGVLCVSGVEISTTGGHYVALGIGPAPYPLGGEARDVIEDVARLGGYGIVAHPESPKPELRWREWSGPFGGLEWLNADSEWRDEPPARLVRPLIAYPFRPPQVLASLLDRPERALARWDVLTRRRRVTALAGADAHARIGFGTGREPYRGWTVLEAPSYEAVFRTFTTRVELDRALSGEPAADAAALVGAIRAGRVYTAIDGLAAPPAFHFSARARETMARMGDQVPASASLELTVETNASTSNGASIVLLRDGRVVSQRAGPSLEYRAAPARGAFRAEVRLAGAPGAPPVPWIVGNPIYVGADGSGAGLPVRPAPLASLALVAPGDGAGEFHVEHDPHSQASAGIEAVGEGSALLFRYHLAGGVRSSQFAAVAIPAAGRFGGYERVGVRARADRPMRLSVQLRAADGAAARWSRSVYLDRAPRDVTVFFDDLRPIGETETRRPDPARLDAILFVVDTTNARSGSAGAVWLERVRLER